MIGFAFRPLKLSSIVAVFAIVIGISVYLMLTIYFQRISYELVESWYSNELVSLQQGNYLSSVTKIQRNLNRSNTLKGVLALDKEGHKLIEFGEIDFNSSNNTPTLKSGLNLLEHGLFRDKYVVVQDNIYIYIFLSNPTLLFVLLLIVLYLVFLGTLFWQLARTSLIAQENLKAEVKIQEVRHKLILKEAVLDLARQVAHDIRSPLTALDFVLSGVEIPEERKTILNNASNRIRQIASDLLDQSKNAGFDLASQGEGQRRDNKKSTSSVKVHSVLEGIVQEKNILAPHVKFQLTNEHELIVDADETQLGRIFSNIIDNAIDATRLQTSPEITISAKNMNKLVTIYIQDNGTGIPTEVLEKVGIPGFSYGKQTGNGMGVSSAKQALNAWGGDLQILSKEKSGTIVIITVPTLI